MNYDRLLGGSTSGALSLRMRSAISSQLFASSQSPCLAAALVMRSAFSRASCARRRYSSIRFSMLLRFWSVWFPPKLPQQSGPNYLGRSSCDSADQLRQGDQLAGSPWHETTTANDAKKLRERRYGMERCWIFSPRRRVVQDSELRGRLCNSLDRDRK
jgi:hypothetical protein